MPTHAYLVCPKCDANLIQSADSEAAMPSGTTLIACAECSAEFPFGEAARTWMRKTTTARGGDE